MDGWNTTFLLGRPIFRGELLVSGRVTLYAKVPVFCLGDIFFSDNPRIPETPWDWYSSWLIFYGINLGSHQPARFFGENLCVKFCPKTKSTPVTSLSIDGNQKSGINSPVEGQVVEILLFTRFLFPSQVVGNGISEPSTI